MLIDDDEALCAFVTRILTLQDYRIESCGSIKDALDKLKTMLPDMILLDLNMPELDGFSFLKFRHLNKSLASIPVIVLSGTQRETFIQRADEMGADLFIEKPVKPHVLIQKIKYIFSLKEKFTYKFKPDFQPSIDAQIVDAQIVECNMGQLKIQSPARFCSGRSIQIESENYIKNGGSPFVCLVQNHLVDLKDGLFRTIVTVTGQGVETKKHFQTWQKTLSR